MASTEVRHGLTSLATIKGEWREQAYGRWFLLLTSIADIDSDLLLNGSGDCPLCHAVGTFRWSQTDDGDGGHCSNCGGPNQKGGPLSDMELFRRHLGLTFEDAVAKIDGGICGVLHRQLKRQPPMQAERNAGDALREELIFLPADWRLVRVGPDKRPIGADWQSVPGLSPDDAIELETMPPAWGLLSGPQSGSVVLDLDEDGWREDFAERTGHPIEDLPQTIAWTSTKPGRSGRAFTVDNEWWPHLANRRPFTRPWQEGDPIGEQGQKSPVTLWELRGDRHQAVIIGAHPETGSYRWLEGCSPQDIPDPAQAPDWLLEHLAVQEVKQAEPYTPQDGDAERAVAMLATIPAEQHSNYDNWLRIGMALHSVDPGLLSNWVDWSRTMAGFDEGECLYKWQSLGKSNRGRPATIASLHHLAKQHGYKVPKRLPPAVPPAKALKLPQSVVIDGGAPELKLHSKDSDWLPTVMKLAFGADRWLHIEGILHRWNGTHYQALPDQALAPRVAPVLSRLYYFNTQTNEDIHHWARPARVTEAIEWFRKTLLPCTDSNPPNAINCRNGTITWAWNGDRMELTFGPHDPAQRFTYCLQYDYDPQADGAHLWRLLDALEPQDRDTMKRLLGSGLQLDRFRASKGRPRALLLLGDGENGKDTIRGALSLTLGARGMTGCTLSDFQQYDKGRKFPISPLRGARINWSPENTSFARLEMIQSLKGAITGEELSWEQKNVQEQPFTPNAIFLFNCNQPPLMDAGQAAMQSRWHAVRFLKRYSSNPDPSDPNQLKADPRLKDDLGFIRENICPAMLNWLLEGLQLAVRDGINFRSTPQTIDAIRRHSCHLFDFAEDVGLEADPTAEIEHRKVWNLLESWYQQQKILHLDNNGRPSWNDRDMVGDPPVRTPNGLERRLKAVFPKLSSRKAPKTRIALLKGVVLV
ncbi:PriCT-2 domain-containing protein [Synechococcus sp. CS-1332]|uniref:PriCT-2 domain-containing protein n=1 Tax=Synechococcus sp. CS-1332 TaxID=2847972 RepID=UPI00223ADBF9|nr:PriCT-2 domain-containing protein [Synechococcus sp. CS-1332]MCT0208670.1 PriCT-2 domain-containing protein [Synechococcus sp. CS-1332]